MRHGETEWSASGRHTCTTDLPLTADGEAGRAEPGPVAGPRRVRPGAHEPPTPRRHTAELAGFDDAEVDDDLVEWAYGDYEGLTTPQIQETVPGWSVWSHPCPGGETAAQVAERLDRVVARARSTEGATLVFAHGHSLRVLAARWLGLDIAEGRLFDLDTATFSVLGDDRGTPVVKRWNVTG